MTTNKRRPEAKGYFKVLEVLRRWDPIGVIDETNQDEYDCCAAPIVHQLDRSTTVHDLCKLMEQIAADHLGIGVDEAHTRSCAEELIRFWQDWKPGQY